MQLFKFAPNTIPGVKIEIFQIQKVKKAKNGSPEIIGPKPTPLPVRVLDGSNGYIGVFPGETQLQLKLEVIGEHSCYCLKPNSLEKVPKKIEAPGKYTKNISVSVIDDTLLLPAWPSNMVCLEIPGHTYNIGIFLQGARFFFVIEEYQPSPMNLPEGMVVSYSLLRGIGTVAYEPYLDAKVYWKNVPFDKRRGLRFMQTGDMLQWNKEDLVSPGCNTTFEYEIKRCVNLSLPH